MKQSREHIAMPRVDSLDWCLQCPNTQQNILESTQRRQCFAIHFCLSRNWNVEINCTEVSMLWAHCSKVEQMSSSLPLLPVPFHFIFLNLGKNSLINLPSSRVHRKTERRKNGCTIFLSAFTCWTKCGFVKIKAVISMLETNCNCFTDVSKHRHWLIT